MMSASVITTQARIDDNHVQKVDQHVRLRSIHSVYVVVSDAGLGDQENL